MKINLKAFKSLFSVKLIAAAAVCLILATSFAYSTMKKDITIEDIDGIKSVSTFKDTVADVLKEKNIEINPKDEISEDMTARLEDGLHIRITRARNITIHADGADVALLTTAPDVKSALDEAEIKLGEKDRIEPGINTALNADTDIRIVRVDEKLIEQTVKVDFTNEVRKNDKLDKGFVQVIQKGQQGQKKLSIQVAYEDGKEVGRRIVDEKTIKAAVNGIVEEGTRTTLVTARGEVTRFVRALKMVATAYDASYESCGKHPGDPNYGVTYTGVKVKPGVVAVDPRVIPLGTWLYIEGYGEALAADIGGSIKGNRIDLYYESPKDVARYGRKAVKVYILDKPKQKF